MKISGSIIPLFFWLAAASGAVIAADLLAPPSSPTPRLPETTRDAAPADKEAAEWLNQAWQSFSAGKSARAFLFLQRALAIDPAVPGAGDLLASLRETLGPETVDALPSTAPPGAWRQLRRQLRSRGWLGLEAGRDSNVNSAPALTTVQIPAFGYRELPLPSQLLTATPSTFLGVNGGFDTRYPWSPRDQLWLRGEASLRTHAVELAYLPLNYSLSGGMRHRGEIAEWGLTAAFLSNWIAKYEAFAERKLVGDVTLPATGKLGLTLFADLRTTVYPNFLDARTSGYRAGVVLRDRPEPGETPAFALSASMGPDRSDGQVKDLDRETREISLLWSRPVAPQQKIRLLLWGTWVDYDHASELFLARRQDRDLGLLAEYDVEIAKGWHLLPRLVMERNASSLPLMDFSRRQYLVELRREF